MGCHRLLLDDRLRLSGLSKHESLSYHSPRREIYANPSLSRGWGPSSRPSRAGNGWRSFTEKRTHQAFTRCTSFRWERWAPAPSIGHCRRTSTSTCYGASRCTWPVILASLCLRQDGTRGLFRLHSAPAGRLMDRYKGGAWGRSGRRADGDAHSGSRLLHRTCRASAAGQSAPLSSQVMPGSGTRSLRTWSVRPRLGRSRLSRPT